MEDGRATDGTRVAVLGLGNVLMGDDGLGPTVVRRLLAGCEFGAGVSVLDIGTPGLDLTPYILGLDALIIVDTVRADAPPGSVRLYRKDDLLTTPPQPRLSPHDPGLKEALLLLELDGNAPVEVLLVGVVPERSEMGTELSRPVGEAVARAEAEVLRELERLGVPAVPRVPPGDPDLWWASAPGSG